MKKEPRVSIVICTFSQDELLERNLRSLKGMHYKNWNLVLVDDASESRIGRKMKKKFPWIDLIVNRKNLGFSVSNNIGIKKALKKYDPDYVLIFNDDCEVLEKDWLNRLVDFAENKKDGGLFGCQIVYPDGSLQWFAKKGKTNLIKNPGTFSKDKEIQNVQNIDNVMGANILVKGRVFYNVGFFDEGFSPFYGEETDFCFRALKKGYKIYYVGNVKVIHHGNKSISKLSGEDVWFIKKRNSIKLEWRHYGFFKIFYYTIVHFGSVFLGGKISRRKRFVLLMRAYFANIKNFKLLQNHIYRKQ